MNKKLTIADLPKSALVKFMEVNGFADSFSEKNIAHIVAADKVHRGAAILKKALPQRDTAKTVSAKRMVTIKINRGLALINQAKSLQKRFNLGTEDLK